MGSAINAIGTKVITRENLLWEVPESWSLAEAATMPTAYMTAYYSVVMRGRLKKGQRILIHSGTGAVGLAAIQLSLSRGGEVRAIGGCFTAISLCKQCALDHTLRYNSKRKAEKRCPDKEHYSAIYPLSGFWADRRGVIA